MAGIVGWEVPVEEVLALGRRIYQGRFYTRWIIETLQNAVDAGATEVDFTCRRLPNGPWELTVSDNGQGMTPDVITNVLFKVGSSRKADAGATGGGSASQRSSSSGTQPRTRPALAGSCGAMRAISTIG